MADINPSLSTYAIRDVVVVGESAKAINAHWGDDGVDHWIPVSQIDARSQVRRAGDSGVLVVNEWFARVAKILPASEVRA
jgi:hypothetical protein